MGKSKAETWKGVLKRWHHLLYMSPSVLPCQLQTSVVPHSCIRWEEAESVAPAVLPGLGSWLQPSWTGTGRALLRWTQFNRLLLTGLGWFTGVCPEIWPSMLSLLILSLTSLLLLWNPPTSIAGYFWRRKPHAYQKATTALNLPPREGQPGYHTPDRLSAQLRTWPWAASDRAGISHLHVTVITGVSQREHAQTSHPPSLQPGRKPPVGNTRPTKHSWVAPVVSWGAIFSIFLSWRLFFCLLSHAHDPVLRTESPSSLQPSFGSQLETQPDGRKCSAQRPEHREALFCTWCIIPCTYHSSTVVMICRQTGEQGPQPM